MWPMICVAMGGAVGCVARFGAGLWVAKHYPQHGYSATLAVNLIGCLLIGILYGLCALRPDLSPALRVGLMVGFLGGLTTFSSFSLDTLRLLENGQLPLALGYVALSVLGGLLATWAGLTLTKL